MLLVLVAPISALLALWLHRKAQAAPPTEPAANNSLLPAAVRLIQNVTYGDREQGTPREDASKAGLPTPFHPPCGLSSKTDISNEERAKLNRLNAAPAVPRSLL